MVIRCFILLMFFTLGVSAQQVRTVKFEQLEEMLNAEDKKLLVVNFWATWCIPCVKELKHFERLSREYESRNLKVLLVSIDYPDKIEKVLKPFLKKNNITAETVVLDESNANKWINRVSEKWEGSIPATLIIDTESKGRSFYEQEFTYEELQKITEPLLK